MESKKRRFRHESSRRTRHGRCGLTILELVVVVAVLAILLALLLPAVQASRESARDLQCRNNLHQMGLALHSYHELYGTLPAGWRLDASGETAFGWAASILTQLEEDNLRNHVDFGVPLDAANNTSARAVTPAIYLCPSDFPAETFDLYEETAEHAGLLSAAAPASVLIELPAANYVGVFGTSDPDAVPGDSGEGPFLLNSAFRFSSFQRGLTNTLLVGERTARKLPSTWLGIVVDGEDAPGRIVGYAWLGPNRRDADECEFDSRHPGHVNFLWADGHVQPRSDSVDIRLYRASATRFSSDQGGFN